MPLLCSIISSAVSFLSIHPLFFPREVLIPSFAAVVLAPFFVHLELLFKAGYRPAFHREIENSIGVEIARIRKIQGDKARAKQL